MRRLVGFVAAPSALLVGCFGSSTSNKSDAGGAFDASAPDTGFEPHEGGTPEGASQGDGSPDSATIDGASSDGTSPEDATPEAATPDATADGPGAPGTDLTAGTIDFGSVNCGAIPPPNTVSFKNTGGAPLTYDATLASGTVFALQGSTQGTVAPGQSATISIAPHAIPGTSTAGTALNDTLTVTTNAPGVASVAITLKVTPQGGAITVSPAVANFGQSFLNVQAADIPLTITNTGNASITVNLGAPQDAEFSTTWAGAPTAAALAPGAALSGAVARFKPTSSGTKADTSAVVVQGAVCAGSAPSVSLAGIGSSLPISITPGSFVFGPTPCGSATANQTVTLTNVSGTPVSYSSSLTTGASYTLQGASGTVPANGTATITVQPAAVPRVAASVAGTSLGDTLTVTTGVGGGGAGATIAITQTGSGAVLALTMGTTSFGPVPVGSPASLPFSVANSGNVAATLLATVGGAGYSLSAAPPTPVNVGSNSQGTVTFAAQPPYGTATGSLNVSTTTNLCQAAQPAPLSLTANSEGPVASANMALLSFTVECGGPSAPTATLTITNNGTSNLLLSSVAASAGFTISAATLTAIAPTQTGTIVVSANTTPLAGDRAGTPRTGTLTFKTNEFGAPTHTVNLSAALNGANLAYYSDAGHTTAITSDQVLCGTLPPDAWWECPYQGTNYYIYNSGNEAVTLAPPTFSDPAYLSLGPAVTANFTLAVGATSVGTAPFWNEMLTSPPANCSTGEVTYPASLAYPVVSGGHVCAVLGALAVPIVGAIPCK